MSRRITKKMFATGIAVAAMICATPTPSMAGGQTSVNCGTTTTVTVTWSQQDDPVQDTHFRVDCTDASNPDVELVTGDLEWEVWAVVYGTQTLANIGALTTTDTDKYVVKIAKGAGPGAANVGSMVLTPAGGNHSSIATGSWITGNLTGNLTVVQTGGNGGELHLRIDGNAAGSITVPIIKSLLILGNVTVSNKVDGVFDVYGTVDDVVIEIEDATANAYLPFNSAGAPGEYDFNADLNLLIWDPVGRARRDLRDAPSGKGDRLVR